MTDIDMLRSRLAAHPGAAEDFSFDASTLVLKVSGKLFAMTGLDESPPRVTLKGDPDDNMALRSLYPTIKPGRYMNKRHWNTVTLDGTVPADVLDEMIASSYALVVRGLPRAARLLAEATEKEEYADDHRA